MRASLSSLYTSNSNFAPEIILEYSQYKVDSLCCIASSDVLNFQPYIYLGALHMNIAFKEEADYGYAKTSDSSPAKTGSIS